VTSSERGYSLIELMMVVGLIGVLGAMVTLSIASVRPGYQADGAMRVVMAEVTAARDTAVSQRRFIRVDFVGDTGLTVTRVEVPAGETQLRSVGFEGGIEFGLVDGAGDTPDGFGIDAAVPASLLFNSDGMLVDASGDPVNQTMFVVRPGAPDTLRAVTVHGATGRIRAYRWNGGDRWTRA
jgi:prepilin-type N-terminal cleavage/methylation domain-containing protein